MFEYQDPNPSFLDRLERRLPWLAIPNLPLLILAGQALFSLFSLRAPDTPGHLWLDPVMVARGEWWRLFTFLMVPSASPMGLIFAVFWLSFFWFLCQSLEAQWGSWRMSFYLSLGWLCQVLVSLGAWHLAGLRLPQTGFYFFLSVQLAFAWHFPNHVIYIYFILPLKMSVLAWVTGAVLLYKALTGWPGEALIIASSLLNYLAFFAGSHARNLKTLHESGQARGRFSRAVNEARLGAKAKHCSQCGKDPNSADLRLCTCGRCGEEGQFWCLEHLAAHLEPAEPALDAGEAKAVKKKKKK